MLSPVYVCLLYNKELGKTSPPSLFANHGATFTQLHTVIREEGVGDHDGLPGQVCDGDHIGAVTLQCEDCGQNIS